MEKVVSKLCDAVCLEVACERNEQEDIMFGGPVMLGYTFYISVESDIMSYKEHIRECIKKYDRPYISIGTTIKKNMNSKYFYDKEMIEEEIKNTSI